MRRGHKSGRPQQGFDPNANRLLPLVLIQQDDLVQQNCTQCAQLASPQAFDRHLPAPFKDVFEDAVERLDGA
jgi:hypothetical protein